MSQRSRGVTVLVPIGAVLGLFVSGMIITEGSKENPLSILVGGGTLVAVALSAWGMWRLQRWALWMSWVLAFGALVVGSFGAHFAWTFWLFEEPTMWDRIKDVLLNPRVMLFLVCPLLWLVYFTHPAVRAQFCKASRNQPVGSES